MTQVHLPDFVGRSEQSVIMLVSSLDKELNDVFKRFHRGEQVAYRFDWNLEQDNNKNDMVVFSLEFDTGEKASIALSPLHWDCLPSVLSLGYLVLMTDSNLLQAGGEPAGMAEKPRAFVIHNAFLGMDGLLKQVNERVKNGQAGNLDLLLRLFESDMDLNNKQCH